MKKCYKYKKFLSVSFFLEKYPNKLLKFKKLKWSKFNFKLSKNIKQFKPYLKQKSKLRHKHKSKRIRVTRFLTNFLLIKNNLFRWERKKQFFKNRILSKVSWRLSFNNFKQIKSLQNTLNFNKLKLLIQFFYKPYFNLHILLWGINLSRSVVEATQILQKGKISVNNKIIVKSIVLKKGDIISLNFFFNLTKNIKQYIKFLSFIENDFYSSKLVIIKDCSDIKINDFYLMSEEYFNTRNLY